MIIFHRAVRRPGIDGAVSALSPIPFILVGLGNNPVSLWQMVSASIASVFLLTCAMMLFRRPLIGKIFGQAATIICFSVTVPCLLESPFAALMSLVALVGISFFIFEFKINLYYPHPLRLDDHYIDQARWAAMSIPVTVALSMISNGTSQYMPEHAVAACVTISQMLFIRWAWKQRRTVFPIVLILHGMLFFAFIFLSLSNIDTHAGAIIMCLSTILIVPRCEPVAEQKEHWWETMINHPTRLLLSTFLALCIIGTLLLLIPGASQNKEISVVDAAFTSVSAVCVTGLIVLDTPNDFSAAGQVFILILIQIGGLGIMGIATVAIHVMGRRLSLRQEWIMKSLTGSAQKDLVSALITILRFTFIAEGIGACLLTLFFQLSGKPFLESLWKGIFTAVSAFCNAGFFLDSSSLMPYHSQPLILHTIAALIIFGGLAPATGMMFPRWLKGNKIPVAARIPLVTTGVLLIAGTICFLAFEWNGVLWNMSAADKFHNAWFQSVTLRTAGFNSVDLAKTEGPTFLMMLCFMIIGGSPGGTAGGIKTTTIGILAMTFWADITNRKDAIIQNRKIRSVTVYRAITIFCSCVFIWFVIVLMLEVTQQIPARDIIFEAASAIGTVGLSTGATASLDEIGKFIVMAAMFAGRVGPMTLFMLLRDDISTPRSKYIDAQISLT